MLRPMFLRAWRENPPRPFSARFLSILFGLTLFYFFAGKLGLTLASVHPSVSAVWPPSGIALAALMLLGHRVWPAVFLGAFLVNLTTAGTVITSFGIASGNTAEAVLGAYLVNRFAGGLQAFDRVPTVFRFIFLAALVSTTVSATVGVATLTWSGLAPGSQFGSIWLTWWLGDATGVIVVAPLLLLLWLEPFPRWDRRRALEAGAVGLALLWVSLAAFSDPTRPTRYAFISIPILLWVLFRFGKIESALAVLLLSGFAIGNLLQIPVSTATDAPFNDPLLLVQAFAGVIAALSLAVSATVSERRRVEGELRNARDELAGKVRQRETLLARAEKLARTGSFEWDADADRVTWSDQMYRIYGCEPGEFGGTIEAFLSYVHSDDRAAVRTTAERAVREAQSFRMRERIVRPDGSTRVLDSVGEPLRDPAGQVIGLSGVCRDVTEEHEAERRIAESEARLRLIIDNVKDYAIFLLDADGNVISWNNGAVRIKGYSAEEILGQPLSRFYVPEDVQQGLPAALLARAARDGHVEHEGWRMRRDGTRFWASVAMTALYDAGGELRGFVKVTRDLSERRRAEVALGELSGRILRLQDEERRRIAHELHDSTSPLVTGLIGKLYKLKRQLGEEDAGKSTAVGESLVLAEHVAGVIRNTASLLHPTILDQNGLQATLRWYLDAFARRTPLRVDTHFPQNQSRLPRTAEMALFRVVEESLANVLRHSNARHARIGIAEKDGVLTLEVTDDGQGMSAAVLSVLKTGSTAGGLGVWTMTERMKQVGGRLVIDSSERGTTVRAVLPIVPVDRSGR